MARGRAPGIDGAEGAGAAAVGGGVRTGGERSGALPWRGGPEAYGADGSALTMNLSWLGSAAVDRCPE
ncbi:hypothetical protein FAGKG844_180060 [Frankia sp. AgKG'84/4]